MFVSLKRVVFSGWRNFFINPGVSFATLFILTLVISLLTTVFLFKGLVDHVISLIQEKADISVYFKENSQEEEILKVKESLAQFPEIRKIKYISKEEAKERFQKKHKDDFSLMESLEVTEDALLAHLDISLSSLEQYSKISNFLESKFGGLIEEVDYSQRKTVIERIFMITDRIKKGVMITAGVLGIIAILVVFSTIKLAILNCKEEIRIQKLVGASNWFIKGPYLVQGFLAGFFAFLISFGLILLSLYFLDPKIEDFFEGFNFFNYFISHIFQIAFIQFISGVSLAMISTYIAIRKYLEV